MMSGYRFQAQLNRISPVGVVPEGLRIDIGFAGKMSWGLLAGSSVEGVDYLVIRPDGVGVIDARELVTAHDGTSIGIRADGYVVPPFELPPLETLLDASFTWPDIELPLHGSARLRSAAPSLAAVNRTLYSFTGAVNMASGSLVIDARALDLDDRQAGVELLTRGYEAFGAGDIATVLSMFHPEIVWHQLDDNPLTGEYHGRESVRGFFEQLGKLSGGTFRLEVHQIFGNCDQVVALVTEHASHADSRLDAAAVHVWRVADGKLAEFTDHHADELAVDRFWGAA